jgi:hypothetical protein
MATSKMTAIVTVVLLLPLLMGADETPTTSWCLADGVACPPPWKIGYYQYIPCCSGNCSESLGWGCAPRVS